MRSENAENDNTEADQRPAKTPTESSTDWDGWRADLSSSSDQMFGTETDTKLDQHTDPTNDGSGKAATENTTVADRSTTEPPSGVENIHEFEPDREITISHETESSQADTQPTPQQSSEVAKDTADLGSDQLEAQRQAKSAEALQQTKEASDRSRTTEEVEKSPATKLASREPISVQSIVAFDERKDAGEDEAPPEIPTVSDSQRDAYEKRISLATLPITNQEHIDGDNCNDVWRVELAGGRAGYLKPERGEVASLRPGDIPPNGQWIREIFACDFDRALGYHLVPDTVPRFESGDAIGGNASLQEEAPRQALPYDHYDALDCQRMAVLDYVLGNLDRHDGNYKTQQDGRPAAIDNGLTLPERQTGCLKSSWVADCLGKPLDSAVVEPARQLDKAWLREQLQFYGIAPAASDGLSARLAEVQRGVITGDSWAGEILNPHTWQIAKNALE